MKEATIRLEEYGNANPAIMAWIEINYKNNTFARDMRERIVSHGTLTHNMEAAIRRNLDNPRKEAAVDTTQLEAAFSRVNPTLKKPAINVGAFRFSPAPDTGANPGAIYVKHEGQYLGKMLGGKFLARCTDEAMKQVLGIAADPLGKAIEHGKLTGRCAICNRNLKDEDSTDRGIGPVCAKRFGFDL